MQLSNLELDPLLLTAVCEYAHEHGLSATDCINEALSDWILAVARGVSLPKSARPERRFDGPGVAPSNKARVVSISR